MLKMMKFGLFAFLAIVAASPALAASKSIKLTKHNLSNWSPYAMYVKGNTTQVCVFCHAPHNADSAETPLWNHNETTASFNIASSRFVKPKGGFNPDVAMDSTPKRTSKKCLSCHDGTVSIGAVVNRGNSGLTNDLDGDIVNGSRADATGLLTGPNKIGLNLSGGHVISFRYDAALVTYLNDPPQYNQPNRFISPDTWSPADRASMRDKLGYMQCHTCHDPHTDRCNDSNKTVGKDPLWRKDCDDGSGTQTGFPNSNATVCATCHNQNFDYYTSPKYPF